MLIDTQLLFWDAAALSADAASTNVIDLSQLRQIGVGEEMVVVLQVDVAADATTGDELYSFNIQTDDNEAFSSAATIVIQDIPRGLLTLGSLHVIQFPHQRCERYLRLFFDGGGTTPTITVTAFLAPAQSVQEYTSYAKNYTIS